MKRIFLAALLLTFASALEAQTTIESVLEEIGRNNTTLKAFGRETEAAKALNSTGNYLENPEVGIGYLWGSPRSLGNRTDFNVTQSFDFPSAYIHRGRVAKLRDRQADLEYSSRRIGILLEAQLYCIDVVHLNKMKKELEVRIGYAESVDELNRKRLESGEGNILDSNKAHFALASLRSSLKEIGIELEAAMAELKRLNGGEDIPFDIAEPEATLPVDFEQWIEEVMTLNPRLAYLESESDIAAREVRLRRAMTFPKFSAGFMSENVPGQRFDGAVFSVSIPLWEGRNTVRAARAVETAAQAVADDSRSQFYLRSKMQYSRAEGLRQSLAERKEALSGFSNRELLGKALDAGQISLLDYIMELGFYYEAVDQVLRTEQQMWRAWAELRAAELIRH